MANDKPLQGNFITKTLKQPEKTRAYTVVAAAAVIAFLAFTVFGTVNRSSNSGGFEAGKVAERDIIAESDIVYVDTKATKIRMDAELRLVSAVFAMDDGISDSSVKKLESFKKEFLSLMAMEKNAEKQALMLQSSFPELSPRELALKIVQYPAPLTIIEQSRLILAKLMSKGVVAFPETGLELFNPEKLELRHWVNGSLVYDLVPTEDSITLSNIRQRANEAGKSLKLSPTLTELAAGLACSFARENTFFDADQSQKRIDAAKSRVEPVMRRISKGEYVIRKGFIVSQEDMEKLASMHSSKTVFNPLFGLAGAFIIILLAFGSLSLLSFTHSGIKLNRASFLYAVLSALLFLVLASAVKAFLPPDLEALLECFLPGTLIAILTAILLGERFALSFTVVLTASLLLTADKNMFSMAQTLFSAIAGIILVRKAEKRIDLVRAGAQLAIIRFLTGFAMSILFSYSFKWALSAAFVSAINGFLSGVLALSFLPLLEDALNSATVFRLQELSDLNAPVLKQLLSVAPGTYSHSVTVAHLAETAAREIGADALLARVGAYYHDIGKIDKPEYFIENQSGYNKHDEINPRLSATVLRGHVKFGLEKADFLRLPQAIREIIEQHHGTSLISYFYVQAKKESADANESEFRYPGPLPASKEAAIVMLADCVEAASRTLKKPTIVKLEQFVKDLVMGRLTSGQLSMSSLSFRDIELIQKSFVKILSGHYHSRIEYPKTKEQS